MGVSVFANRLLFYKGFCCYDGSQSVLKNGHARLQLLDATTQLNRLQLCFRLLMFLLLTMICLRGTLRAGKAEEQAWALAPTMGTS